MQVFTYEQIQFQNQFAQAHNTFAYTQTHKCTQIRKKKRSLWTKANRNDFGMLGLIREPYIFTQIVGLNYNQGKEQGATEID